MTSTGSRRATRLVPAVFCLLLAVLGGRQLAGTAAPVSMSSLDGPTLSSSSDTGFLAVASRVPVPAQPARLQLGAFFALGTAALLMLVWTGALGLGRGRVALDAIGVRCLRRGPPIFLGD